MTPLENPPDNPCWGCGPNHPRGLHLTFDRDGDSVVTTYTPKEDEVGWPGLLHTGLHYLVVFEACYWAALTLSGKVQTATGPQVFDQRRIPRTGVPFRVRARLAGPGPEPDTLLVEATSESADGRLLATARATFRPASRAVVEKAGLKVPQYLLDEMAP